MKGFEHLLTGLPAFERVKSAVKNRATPVLVTGLSNVHKAHMIVSLAGLLETGGLAVVPDEAAATRLVEDINIMAGEGANGPFRRYRGSRGNTSTRGWRCSGGCTRGA